MQEQAPALRSGFTQLPNALIDSPNFNAIEKIIIWTLISFMWDNPGCWPSRKRLAVMTQLSPRTLVDAFAALREKKIIYYKRRGYGQSNLYQFLDPSIEAMIERLAAPVTEMSPTDAPAQEIAQDKNVTNAPQLPELQPITEVAPAQPQIESQKDPVSPTGSISAKSALHSSATNAPHLNKKTQPEKDSVKTTQQRAQAPACEPKSKFSLIDCRNFASSLRPAGITNPYGFGTTIWLTGREDQRIAEFISGSSKAAAPAANNVQLTGGYDQKCQHCSGLGLRYAQDWWSDEMIACDCNQRKD